MGKFRKSEELLYWRFFLLLYLAGFAAGILFVNLAWRYRTGDLETLTLFTLQGSGTLRMEGYLWYLTKKRGGTLLVLHALGITVLGKLAIAAGLLWSGFLGGTLAAIAVLQLGAKGLAVLTAAAVPQIFVYLPAGLFYLTAVWRMSARSWAGEKLAEGTYRDYLMTSGAGLALIFCGILLECYVNPHVLEAVLGI